MLLWYSQEARAYALLVLLCALSLLYFVRALRRAGAAATSSAGASSRRSPSRPTTSPSSRSPPRRSGCCAAAAARRCAGLWIVAVAGLAAGAARRSTRCPIGHAEWIGKLSLGHRLWETGVDLRRRRDRRHHRPARAARCRRSCRWRWSSPRCALLVCARRAARSAAPPACRWRVGAGRDRRSRSLLGARSRPSKDFVLARNLLPALVPLLVAVAIGVTLRGARRAGAVARRRPARLLARLLRLGERLAGPAAARLGGGRRRSSASRTAPRAMVTWTLGEASLRYYLSTGSFQVRPSEGYAWLRARSRLRLRRPGAAAARAPARPAASARSATRRSAASTSAATRCPGPSLARLRLRELRDAELNFRTNGVLLDGVGPGLSRRRYVGAR